MVNLQDPAFIQFCEKSSHYEVAEKVLDGSVRGLDKMALNAMLKHRSSLPETVEKILVAYFFASMGRVVYHRHDLSMLYQYWARREIRTVDQALRMAKEDIQHVLSQVKKPGM
ncbi:hypothetical protein [Domibacillus enclensis]|uniref:Uncharacterized protein n=1 Tax=Domibacillus enclensis TaxID=1017273 RepID=A0A1N6P035_9BACI|nr:hypothetical protein [Domibacillus enclensis]OXS80198.1 hypothetical protein B1B05_01590 [Domibacillus enclensis]SIP97680.1 hypothetical protein SAMN05443094_101335 [Domibacillus enclensis]